MKLTCVNEALVEDLGKSVKGFWAIILRTFSRIGLAYRNLARLAADNDSDLGLLALMVHPEA